MNEEKLNEHFEEYLNAYNDIIHFISKFKDAQKCFLNGCCYWFARILFHRFMGEYLATITICYNQVDGHFVTRFFFPMVNIVRLFDVRGDVTDLYHDINSFKDIDEINREDDLLYKRLERDCIRG